MPTIIDSLVVTLGLDPSQFQQGQKAAGAAFDKTKKQALEDGKSIEQAGKQASAFFSRLRTEALGFFAVVVGATSLANFVKSTIELSANTGRLATNLGMSTEALSAWEGAVRQTGGTTEDAVGSIQSLVGAFEQIQLTGQSPLIPYLQLLRISLKDLGDPSNTLLKLADAFSNMDPRQAMALGQGMGLSPSMINLLEKGRAAVLAVLDAQSKAYVVTERDAEAAQKAQQQISLLKDSYRALGQEILTDALPGLTAFGDALTRLAQSPELQRLSAAFEGLARSIGASVADILRALGITPTTSGIVRWLESQVKQATWMVQGMDALGHWMATPFSQRHAAGNWWKAASNFFKAAGVESTVDTSRAPAGQADVPSAPAAADLTSTGLRPGVLAGVFAESGNDPNAFNPRGGGQGAFGIGQWRGERQVALRAFAAARGKPVTDMATQIAFMLQELQDPKYASITGAGSEQEALDRFLRLYEAPGSGYAGDMARGRTWLASHKTSVSNRRSETHIGKIEVHTKAMDGPGVARDLHRALANNALVNQADGGLQ